MLGKKKLEGHSACHSGYCVELGLAAVRLEAGRLQQEAVVMTQIRQVAWTKMVARKWRGVSGSMSYLGRRISRWQRERDNM